MAKRPTVEVDEEYLKEVMAGGAVLPKKEQHKPETEQPSTGAKPPAPLSQPEQPLKEEDKGIETQAAESIEPKESVKPARKKKEAQDYEGVFLQRRAGVPRRQTYISSHLYEKISRFLPVIAGGLSVTGYIDNILTHHMEQYKEDINELYERKSQKPL